MEELNKDKIAELETLRARLAELEKQNPVAVIGLDWQLLYVGSGPIAQLVRGNNLKVGTKLYAAPVVSPDVEKLMAALDSYKEAGYGDVLGVSGIHEQLRAENQSLKTELEAARNDAEKFKLLVGEMRDGMVVWFDVNPHGAPEGTQYYVSIEQAKGGVK